MCILCALKFPISHKLIKTDDDTFSIKLASNLIEIPLTDSKGKAWTKETPIGINKTTTGYSIITEKAGRKSSTFSEYTVSTDGVVSKKGAKLSPLDTITSGIYNGDTQIYDTNANKILFVLDGVNSSLIDTSDFVVTNFV